MIMKDKKVLTWLYEHLTIRYSEDPHTDYMTRLRSIIKTIDPEQETPAMTQTELPATKHPHAELMMEYAKDAMETDKPWLLWERSELPSNAAANSFKDLKDNPSWFEQYTYRRKTKTININGHEVPEPLRVEPTSGTMVYLVRIDCQELVAKMVCTVSNTYARSNLITGLIHLTKEAAIAHAEALLSLTATGACAFIDCKAGDK